MARIIDQNPQSPTFGLLINAPVQAPAPANKSTLDPNSLDGRLEAGEAVRVDPAYPGLSALKAAGYIVEAIPGSGQGVLSVRKGTTQAPSYVTPTTQNPPTPEDITKIVLDAIAEIAANKPVPPNLEISPQLAADYLNQAKNTVNPEYQQYFDQTKQDLLQGFQQISQDVQANEKKLEAQYGSQLSNTQENLAKRGLTFSTIRNQAEKTLAQSTQDAIDAGRAEAQRRALTLGNQGERQLGSANLPEIPGLNAPPTPILNLPGQFLFNKPEGTRSLFTPTGGTTGELEYKKKAATADLYNTYIQGERQLRGGISA